MAAKAVSLRLSLGSLVAAGLAAGMVPAPAAAQSNARLDRIEAQMRALQRAVFPGGDERFFEPEITAQPGQPQQPQANSISTSALTGMLERLEAIETQLARLTAATEVNENALAQVEMRINTLEQTGGATLDTQQRTGVISVPSSSTGTSTSQPPARATQPAASNAQPATAPTASAPASNPSPSRVAAVQEIAKPASGDAGDDEYVYGFRLWDAGFYPEAQQQLALFIERYPNHSRTTFGRNLLGRAYLDAGDARRAATYFFENYQADKTAARAPDSLLYLAESMIALGDTNRACIALAEFGDTYPALATGRLKSQYDANRGRVDCTN